MAWMIDSAHTQIEFSVRHMMISKAHGQFDRFTVNSEIDEKNVAGSKIDVQIEAALLLAGGRVAGERYTGA